MEKEDRNLIEKAQQGNISAFEELVQKYDRRILSLAYQFTRNTEDAKDIYQEVLMRVYNKLNRFRFESNFYTWLYRIVVNCAINYLKRRTRHSHQSIDEINERQGWDWVTLDTGPTPETLAISTEIREKIHATIETLPLMQKVIFILRFLEDFKIKDIAQIIGRSEGTVKNQLFRSTEKMRESLASYL